MKKSNGLGTASLVLGIVGMLLSCVFIGVVPTIIGLILGIVGLCQKDKSKGTAIAGTVCSSIGVVIFVIVLCAGLSTTENKVEEKEDARQEIAVVDNKNKNNADLNNEKYSEKDFEIKEYIYENTIGDTLYFIVIKNNSNANVSVSGNATAKDADGNAIGADDMDISVVGAGEISVGYFYFDGVKNIDHVDFKLKYNDDIYVLPVVGNLEVKQTLNDKNVIISVTNNGDKEAQFVKACALFFDENNNVIRYQSEYVADDDHEIKVGDTLSVQLDCYNGYDHVEVYFTGRTYK